MNNSTQVKYSERKIFFLHGTKVSIVSYQRNMSCHIMCTGVPIVKYVVVVYVYASMLGVLLYMEERKEKPVFMHITHFLLQEPFISPINSFFAVE